jgi:hypothetical protein
VVYVITCAVWKWCEAGLRGPELWHACLDEVDHEVAVADQVLHTQSAAHVHTHIRPYEAAPIAISLWLRVPCTRGLYASYGCVVVYGPPVLPLAMWLSTLSMPWSHGSPNL